MSDAVLPIDAFEEQRVTNLRVAQSKAERLFGEIEARGGISVRPYLLLRHMVRGALLGGEPDALVTNFMQPELPQILDGQRHLVSVGMVQQIPCWNDRQKSKGKNEALRQLL